MAVGSPWWMNSKVLGYSSLWTLPELAFSLSPYSFSLWHVKLPFLLGSISTQQQGQTLQKWEGWVRATGDWQAWDPDAQYRLLGCWTSVCCWTPQTLMKALCGHLKGCLYSEKTVKVVLLWGSGMAWVLQSTSSALLCSVQEGTAASAGEAICYCQRQLSAHQMHPVPSSSQWVNPCCRSWARSLLFCFRHFYQLTSSVSTWLSEVSVVMCGGISVREKILLPPSQRPGCQEGVLINGAKMLSCERSCSCMLLCFLLAVCLDIFFVLELISRSNM